MEADDRLAHQVTPLERLRRDTSLTTSQALREANLAAEDLADALKSVGVKLPSLRGDFPTVDGCPMVQLGGVSALLARELAELVRRQTP